MRFIPSALQAKLDGGATTLARCVIVTRRDGVVQGFPDHDEDILLDAVICRARTGIAASEATQQLGLAVTGAAISGALASDTLNEADLAAGLYDAASVTMYLVDWSEPALHLLLASGVLGEVDARVARSRRSCVRSHIACKRKAGGSIPRHVRPISAMRAARSISRHPRIAGRGPCSRSPRRARSPRRGSTLSPMAGSRAAS